MPQLTETNRMNGHARAAVKARANEVLDDFSTLRKDMRKLARAANKAARVEVKHAGEQLSETASHLRTRARDQVSLLGDQVRERPAAAIGVSLGAGLLLGMLLAPRR